MKPSIQYLSRNLSLIVDVIEQGRTMLTYSGTIMSLVKMRGMTNSVVRGKGSLSRRRKKRDNRELVYSQHTCWRPLYLWVVNG